MSMVDFYASMADGAVQGVIVVLSMVVVICLALVGMEVVGGKV